MRDAAQLPTPTMATRTEPMGSPPLSDSSLSADIWLCGMSRVGTTVVRLSLDVDQPVEPRELALDGLDAVPVQLRGVPVGAAVRGAHRVEPLLKPRAPALEDREPDVEGGAREERE